MNTYAITIIDTFFNHELTGIFKATNKYWAIVDAKDFYASELDTDREAIIILKIVTL